MMRTLSSKRMLSMPQQLLLLLSLLLALMQLHLAQSYAPVVGYSRWSKRTDPWTTTTSLELRPAWPRHLWRRTRRLVYDDVNNAVTTTASTPKAPGTGTPAIKGVNGMMPSPPKEKTSVPLFSSFLDTIKASKGIPIPSVTARRPLVDEGMRYRSDDWLRNFASIPNSFVLRRIRFHLITNTVISILTVLLFRGTSGRLASIPMTVHSLMGGFLSLLLVFRTNTAYARFYEARDIWSKAKAACRNLALAVAVHVQPHAPRSAAALRDQLAAFPEALTYTCLSGSVELSDAVKSLILGTTTMTHKSNNNSSSTTTLLSPAILLAIRMHQTIHYAAAKESPTVGTDRIEALHMVHVSDLIDSLVGAATACERIVKTPVPWSYSRHTSRFLTLWSGTLPFALVQQAGWLTVPIVCAACWCLFGIEEIGHLIEQPFGCSSRHAKTKDYDVSLPIHQYATQIKEEVQDITSMTVD